MKHSRALRLSFASLLLLVPVAGRAAAQSNPTPISPVPLLPAGGGIYTGPGDTVPPPCFGPGCPPPPTPPPPTICWNGPCSSDYAGMGCYGPCFASPAPLPGVYNIAWTDVNGNPVAPACMQGQGVYRIYHITVQNLLDAGNAASWPWSPRSNLCFFDTCPVGIDAVFVYTTLPFQYHPEGIQTSSGGYLQACGLGYDVKLAYDDGYCSDVGGRASLLKNATFMPLSCRTDLVNMTLQFDVACLQQLLAYYGALGLYNWWTGSGVWLTNNSIVFVVAIKCCGPNGEPSCDY